LKHDGLTIIQELLLGEEDWGRTFKESDGKVVSGLHHCRIQITYTGIRSNNDKSRSIRESLASWIQKGFLTGWWNLSSWLKVLWLQNGDWGKYRRWQGYRFITKSNNNNRPV